MISLFSTIRLALALASFVQAAPQSNDFAFAFDFKPCMTTTLDTFKNVYTREMGLGARTQTIPLKLPPEQLAAIRDAIVSVRFFDYPADFRTAPPAGTEATTVSPSASYRLRVRLAGAEHTVLWDDRFLPRSDEADRLLKLFEYMNGVINGLPEVKRLPVSKVTCR